MYVSSNVISLAWSRRPLLLIESKPLDGRLAARWKEGSLVGEVEERYRPRTLGLELLEALYAIDYRLDTLSVRERIGQKNSEIPCND